MHTELLIYDELGRCVFGDKKHCKKGSNTIECDISFLRTGINPSICVL